MGKWLREKRLGGQNAMGALVGAAPLPLSLNGPGMVATNSTVRCMLGWPSADKDTLYNLQYARCNMAYNGASFSRLLLFAAQAEGRYVYTPAMRTVMDRGHVVFGRSRRSPAQPPIALSVRACAKQAALSPTSPAGSGTMELIYIMMARCVPPNMAAISCPVGQGEAARRHAHAGALFAARRQELAVLVVKKRTRLMSLPRLVNTTTAKPVRAFAMKGKSHVPHIHPHSP